MNISDEFKNHELLRMVKKFEGALMRIQKRLDELDDNEISKELTILAIEGEIRHQMGHIKYFRSLLN